MIVLLKDDGKLEIWVRKTARKMEVDTDHPDIIIKPSNARRVALAMLKPYPAKILPVESNRRIHLVVAVKVRDYTLKALKVLSNAERISGRKAAELLEKPTPRKVLKILSNSKTGYTY